VVDKNSLTDTCVNCITVNNFKDFILKELEPETCTMRPSTYYITLGRGVDNLLYGLYGGEGVVLTIVI